MSCNDIKFKNVIECNGFSDISWFVKNITLTFPFPKDKIISLNPLPSFSKSWLIRSLCIVYKWILSSNWPFFDNEKETLIDSFLIGYTANPKIPVSITVE